MTQARYIGDPRFNGQGPAEVDSCTFHFVKGEWREINAEAAARLVNNNHFEVDTDAGGLLGKFQRGIAPDTLIGPTVEQLRADCDALGIEYHHLAGVKKLTALLDAATAPASDDEA